MLQMCRAVTTPSCFDSDLTHVSEVMVSSRSCASGDTVTNMSVLAFPPRLSCNNMVSLELRYGTKGWSVARAEITSPSAASDLLMLLASRSCSSTAPERDTRSLPAKSSKLTWTQEQVKTGVWGIGIILLERFYYYFFKD